MFKFLIEDHTEDEIALRIVTLGGLLEEMQRAVDDTSIRIAVYEIHRRVLDWTVRVETDDSCIRAVYCPDRQATNTCSVEEVKDV